MSESLRAKVSRVLDRFAEDGLLKRAMKECGVHPQQFYDGKRLNPDLEERYMQILRDRADMCMHEREEIAFSMVNAQKTGSAQKTGTYAETDPRCARVAADILEGNAKKWDRERFGDKIDMNVSQTVDLAGAIEAAKRRALRPRRDLETITDAEYAEIPAITSGAPPDSQSATPPAPPVDPFED